MDLRQLSYFLAVYEHGNLSHAASHLAVAQSAISHHLANLEAELGARLFLRRPRGMEATAAGHRLHAHARTILQAVRAAEHDMLHDARDIAGEFAVGLPYSVMKGIGVALMQAILADYPKVRLSIVEGLSGNTHAALLSSEVDLALFYNPQKDRHVTIEPVLEEAVLCVGRADVIGASAEPITFEQLSRLPVLLLRHGASSRALIDRPGLLSRLETNARLQLNSVSGITNGMLAGLGCTIAPQVFVREQLQAGTLQARPIVEPQLSRKLFLGHRRDHPPNRLFEAIKQLILDLIGREVRSGRWQAEVCFPDQAAARPVVGPAPDRAPGRAPG